MLERLRRDIANKYCFDLSTLYWKNELSRVTLFNLYSSLYQDVILVAVEDTAESFNELEEEQAYNSSVNDFINNVVAQTKDETS